jgi:hypothetical protein
LFDSPGKGDVSCTQKDVTTGVEEAKNKDEEWAVAVIDIETMFSAVLNCCLSSLSIPVRLLFCSVRSHYKPGSAI